MLGTLTFCVTIYFIVISLCHGHLHPPTNLTTEWIDPMTVKVSWSWKRPKNLSRDCKIKFEYRLHDTEPKRSGQTHFLEVLLSEREAKWLYSVHTVGTSSSSCDGWRSSAAEIEIEAPEPRVAVPDFKCHLSKSDMNCSWIPDPLSPVTLSYRECGERPDILKKGFRQCNLTYNSGKRRVCHLSGNFLQKELCMVADTPNGISTFRAQKVVTLPNMKITEEGTDLVLTLAPLTVETHCFLYNICYSFCDNPRICLEHSIDDGPRKIPYDQSCQYKFQYRAQTSDYCSQINSGWSEQIIYGFTDRTLTVVAIVIPVIVSACVILSCICFRRHKDIICPELPDPSAIFKEMINSNSDMKPSVSTYKPVQVPIETVVVLQGPHSSRLVST